jgi:hypothetical protein
MHREPCHGDHEDRDREPQDGVRDSPQRRTLPARVVPARGALVSSVARAVELAPVTISVSPAVIGGVTQRIAFVGRFEATIALWIVYEHPSSPRA